MTETIDTRKGIVPTRQEGYLQRQWKQLDHSYFNAILEFLRKGGNAHHQDIPHIRGAVHRTLPTAGSIL